jgi:hypothetical protein
MVTTEKPLVGRSSGNRWARLSQGRAGLSSDRIGVRRDSQGREKWGIVIARRGSQASRRNEMLD